MRSTEANQKAGTEVTIDVQDSEKEDESAQDCFVLPIWPSYSSTITPVLKTDDKREGPREEEQVFMDELERLKRQEKEANEEAEALRKKFEQETKNLVIQEGAAKTSMADFTNLETVVNVSPIPTSRIHSSHPSALILGDPTSAVQTRSKVNTSSGAHAFVSYFKIQKVSVLVDLPYGKKAIGTKWVYRNKKDERGVVVRNKARLVAQGHRQEEGIDMMRFSSFYVDDIIFGSTKKSWCDEFEALMKSKFQMSSMGELTFFLGLQVKQKADGIFISQDKLREASDVNVVSISFRSLQSLPSRVVKRIFRSLNGGNPNWAFGIHNTEVVNFIGRRLFLGMPQKGRPIMATFYRSQNMLLCKLLWQNTSYYHSKTKHIAIRHHFIRDAYEKKLIQVLKIHTDDNVADLLTKAFDVSRFQFLVVTIGMINP
ncbi:putative ribonuclease H-like domain-containing protein [Tanacetum coccineum]